MSLVSAFYQPLTRGVALGHGREYSTREATTGTSAPALSDFLIAQMATPDLNQDVSVEALPRFWEVPWEFTVHGLVGTLIFSIIAAFAVLLDVAIAHLKAHSVDIVIMVGLRAAEYALFGTDLVLYGVFLWGTGKKMVRRL